MLFILWNEIVQVTNWSWVSSIQDFLSCLIAYFVFTHICVRLFMLLYTIYVFNTNLFHVFKFAFFFLNFFSRVWFAADNGESYVSRPYLKFVTIFFCSNAIKLLIYLGFLYLFCFVRLFLYILSILIWCIDLVELFLYKDDITGEKISAHFPEMTMSFLGGFNYVYYRLNKISPII